MTVGIYSLYLVIKLLLSFASNFFWVDSFLSNERNQKSIKVYIEIEGFHNKNGRKRFFFFFFSVFGFSPGWFTLFGGYPSLISPDLVGNGGG